MSNPRSIVVGGLFWAGTIAWVIYFWVFSEDIRPAVDALFTNGHAEIAALWLLVLCVLSGFLWGYDRSGGLGNGTKVEEPPRVKRSEKPPPDWYEDY